jgi:hypothetical protein
MGGGRGGLILVSAQVGIYGILELTLKATRFANTLRVALIVSLYVQHRENEEG